MTKKKTAEPADSTLSDLTMSEIADLLEMKPRMTLSDGVVTGEAQINPDKAQLLLDINTHNRTLSGDQVAAYARMMRNGDWGFNGAPVNLDIENKLQDGQHRLESVVMSGTTQRFMVNLGLPPEAVDITDTGRKRSASDTLGLHGLPNAANAAAAIRLLLTWEAGRVLHSSYSVGNIEVWRFVQEHGTDTVNESVHVGLAARTGGLPVSTAVVAAVHFRLKNLAGVDSDELRAFFDRVCEGVGLTPGDPELAYRRLHLRRREAKVRTTRAEAVFYLIRAWNARVKGERLTKLQLPRFGLNENTFPRLIVAAGQPEIDIATLPTSALVEDPADEQEQAQVSA